MSWIACMAHIKHEHSNYLTEYIAKRFSQYIIAMEISPVVGEHFHFLLYAKDNKSYSNFAQNVFKQKFALRGRATTDNPRQYGRVKNIKDIDRMIAYTVKDKNVIYKVDDEKMLKDAFARSFSKNKDKITIFNEKISHYVNNARQLQNDGFLSNRNDFVETIITTYWEVFEKLPSRNFQINQIYKYTKDAKWYMMKSGTFTDPDSFTYSTIKFISI